MNELRTQLIKGWFSSSEFLSFWHWCRQGQIFFVDIAMNVVGENFAEDGAGGNSSTIVTAEANNIMREGVESRQIIGGYSDMTVPFWFKL